MYSIRVLPFVVLCSLGAVSAQTPTPLTAVPIAQMGTVTDITAPPEDTRRLFASGRSGQIRLILDGVLQATPFLDLSAKVLTNSSERGLLGLTFHPNYANNGFFYVNYTRVPDGATMIERYQVSQLNPDVADPGSSTLVLTQSQFNGFHNGGGLQFGPDGFLYIALGESTQGCMAQAGNNFLGKILRLDVDGGSPYAIPPSNPFVGNPAFFDEIWSYGMRNPFRISFDRENGDLYIADVGFNNREEINVQTVAAGGGQNYGWPAYEGNFCRGQTACGGCALSYSPPAHEYAWSRGFLCCVIGGYVYRGCAIPDLRGTYFYADHCNGIFSFRLVGGTPTQLTARTAELGLTLPLRPTTFGEDACGEIYFGTRDGRIYKIAPGIGPHARDLGFAKPNNNGIAPVLDFCGLLNAGNSGDVRLRDAAPSAATALWFGLLNNPTPILGATIVPIPPIAELPVVTDANGEFQFVSRGGGGPLALYLQWIVLDGNAPRGFTVSNALEMSFQ